jgi:hypothetical protein
MHVAEDLIPQIGPKSGLNLILIMISLSLQTLNNNITNRFIKQAEENINHQEYKQSIYIAFNILYN